MDPERFDEYEKMAGELAMSVRGLTRDDLLKPCEPGKWSIQQVVVHVADTDLVLAERMKRIIAEDGKPPILAFNENRWLSELATNERSLSDCASLVEISRREMARILRTVPPEGFGRIGLHSVMGELTLEAVFKKSIDHFQHHLKFVHGKRATMGKQMW